VRSPLADGDLRVVPEVGSTQDELTIALHRGHFLGGVLALEQTHGRGRFKREWISGVGDSLTASIAFHTYAWKCDDSPPIMPHLIGMGVALAAAGVLHAGVSWPNDLTLDGRKVGGILTELVRRADDHLVPVVGIGINLAQRAFPAEIAGTSTTLLLSHGETRQPEELLRAICARLEKLPEPTSWSNFDQIWRLFDATNGKQYRLADGRVGLAIGIGSEGELLCSIDGETEMVLAADALFGKDN